MCRVTAYPVLESPYNEQALVPKGDGTRADVPCGTTVLMLAVA